MPRIFLATLFVVFAHSASAQNVIYLCEMEREASGYIQPMIGIGYDPESSEAFAFDAIIAQNSATAKKAYLAENSGKRVVIAWRALFRNSWGQTAQLSFRATISKANGSAQVSAKPSGYADSFSGRGKCAVSDMEIPGIN